MKRIIPAAAILALALSSSAAFAQSSEAQGTTNKSYGSTLGPNSNPSAPYVGNNRDPRTGENSAGTNGAPEAGEGYYGAGASPTPKAAHPDATTPGN